MKMRHPFLFAAAVLFAAVAVGCLNPKISLTEPVPPQGSLTPADSTVIDSIAAAEVTSQDMLLRSLVLEEDLLDTSVIERLETAAKLLETARAYLDDDQFATAGYSFALARVMVMMIDPETLADSTAEFYNDLMADVEHFYDDYVARSPVLPADSPPEAVIAGIEEAEGDTILTIDEIVEITRGEVDTTALAEAMSKIVQLPPVTFERNKQVNNAIKFFQGKGRKVFARWLQRAAYNVPFMTRILREEGIPDEMVYLAMIESGFNYTAYSYAHAAGPWQFIQGTGRLYGLKINWWYDERRDPEKATRAACRYLRKLYLQFGDWNLAMAAYNCGEGNVAKQIRRTGQKDFWKMTKLPRESRNYVPTYHAAAIMAMNPTEYGFEPVTYRLPDPVDSIFVTEPVDLKLAASLVGSDYQTMKTLNPWCLRWSTPPEENLWMILPDGTAEAFHTAYASLPEDQKHVKQSIHVVRRGETLAAIAGRYGTSVGEILAVKENRIKNKNRLVIGQEIVLPVAPAHYKETAAEYKVASDTKPSGEAVTYKVRKGDNLSAIARRYGTTVSAIKANNRLYKSNKIYAGQKLVIRSGKATSVAAVVDDGGEPASVAHKGATEAVVPSYHTVKRGETFSSIAGKYGMTASRLMSLNGISDARKLKAGAKLRLSGDVETTHALASSATVHTVKRGDTVGKIAKRYGVREAEIVRANGLGRSAVIHPGDRLKIPNS